MEGEVKYIWDSLRRKWLVLTPEEWVRRHVIGWLVSVKRVPALRISQEYPVNINSTAQRADVVVMDNSAHPLALVECKAPDIKIDSSVFEQATRYNAVVQARYVILTNGMEHYCYEFADSAYQPINAFPKLG
jgi:type I site-specific restriction endonuclease